MAWASAFRQKEKRAYKRCATKRERLLCIINSGVPHHVIVLDGETNETSCAPAIGGFTVYEDRNLKTYSTYKEAEEVANKIYNELLEDLKNEN